MGHSHFGGGEEPAFFTLGDVEGLVAGEEVDVGGVGLVPVLLLGGLGERASKVVYWCDALNTGVVVYDESIARILDASTACPTLVTTLFLRLLLDEPVLEEHLGPVVGPGGARVARIVELADVVPGVLAPPLR